MSPNDIRKSERSVFLTTEAFGRSAGAVGEGGPPTEEEQTHLEILLTGKNKLNTVASRPHGSVRLATPLALLAAAALAVACDGHIVLPQDLAKQDPSHEEKVNQGTANEELFTCSEASPPPLSNEMKRLTHRELVLVLSDIFDSSTVKAISSQMGLYPKDSLTDPAETFVKNHTREHVNGAFYVADGLGAALSLNRSSLKRLVGDCIVATTPTQACVKMLIVTLGAKVFRRPLTSGSADAEVEKLLAVYGSESNSTDGLRLLISRLMLAPDFWFHLEGRGQAAAQGVKLTSYEIASRISFSVTGSLPDAELLAAAKSNQLSNLNQVENHVRRLLATERGKQQVLEFFSNWLVLDAHTEISQLPAFLNGIESEGLVEEMVDEMKRFVEHVVFDERGGFSDLFLNESLFAKSKSLASIYQTSQWSGAGAATRSSGPYKGIVLRGKLLMSEGQKSSPILRGVFLRRRMLCDDISPPSNDLIEQRPAQDPDPVTYSGRMRTQLITEPAQCAHCHRRINPMGFVFENFDSLGRWRDEEKVYSDEGAVVAKHPIDTDVVIDGVGKDPLATNSPAALNTALSKSDVVLTCLTRRVFRHLNLRKEVNQVADNCRLHDMRAKIKDATLFEFFVASIANDSIFTKSM